MAGSGTDYSLQDAAQLSLGDLACANVTTLTSVTGGFTTAMIGNAIYIATNSANWVAGFYFITARADTNTVTLDRVPVTANATAGAGKVGGAQVDLAKFNGYPELNLGVIWIKSGSYTMGTTVSLVGMSAGTNPVTFMNGYNTTRGDNPTSTNRPLIDLGVNGLSSAANWEIKNISFTGSGTVVFSTTGNIGNRIINCKFVCTGGATRAAASSNSNSNIYYNCEFSSAGGYGMASCLGSFIGCYFHDSAYGANAVGAAATLVNCIIDTCSTAGLRLTGASCNFINLVIYNCVLGIDYNTQTVVKLTNSIITNCTTGVSATSVGPNNMSNFNIWNNTTDATNVIKGSSDLTTNPLLTDPANGDFTLTSVSPALAAAAQNGVETGAVGSYRWNIGVDQDNNPSSIGAAY
jgi:hypothetical protein